VRSSATICFRAHDLHFVVACHGVGKHFWDVPVLSLVILGKVPTRRVTHLPRKTNNAQLYYVASIFYCLIQGFAKFSVLFLYLRIFPDSRFRLVLKITIGWMALKSTAYAFSIAFQCVPVQGIWDRDIPARCINMNMLTISGAGVSIVEDIFIMLLPISELKGLNLTLRKRIALCFIFAIGSLYLFRISPSWRVRTDLVQRVHN
jgi:hypothetical protein